MERDGRPHRSELAESAYLGSNSLFPYVCLHFFLSNTEHFPCSSRDCRIIFCSIANIVANAKELSSVFAYVLATCGSPSLVCVVGNHLLIHLKEAGEAGMSEGTSYRPKLSTINFVKENVASGN